MFRCLRCCAVLARSTFWTESFGRRIFDGIASEKSACMMMPQTLSAGNWEVCTSACNTFWMFLGSHTCSLLIFHCRKTVNSFSAWREVISRYRLLSYISLVVWFQLVSSLIPNSAEAPFVWRHLVFDVNTTNQPLPCVRWCVHMHDVQKKVPIITYTMMVYWEVLVPY